MIAFSTFPMLLIYAAPLRFCSGLCFISSYRVVSRSQVRENDLLSIVLLQATWLTRTDLRLPKKLKETDENQGFPNYIVQLESRNKNWRQGVMHIEEAIRKISNTFRNFSELSFSPWVSIRDIQHYSQSTWEMGFGTYSSHAIFSMKTWVIPSNTLMASPSSLDHVMSIERVCIAYHLKILARTRIRLNLYLYWTKSLRKRVNHNSLWRRRNHGGTCIEFQMHAYYSCV